MSSALIRWSAPLAVAGSAAMFAACASYETPGPATKEEVVAVSVSNHLLRFNAGRPQVVRDRRPLTGLAAGERVVGIDYRVARGELYALGASGQLYRIDVDKAAAVPVGSAHALPGTGEWGVDFNPTVDRIRVVGTAGQNLRRHPDTGAPVDGDAAQPGIQPDAALKYAPGDAHAGSPGTLVAAAYTYNKTNDKITTNFALDGALGTLVHQGTREGVTPVVSPNTGLLYTVGALGTGAVAHATFDISDVSNTAYAGLRTEGARETRWHRIDLATGRATFIGTVGGGEALAGAAIEP